MVVHGNDPDAIRSGVEPYLAIAEHESLGIPEHAIMVSLRLETCGENRATHFRVEHLIEVREQGSPIQSDLFFIAHCAQRKLYEVGYRFLVPAPGRVLQLGQE